MSTSNGASSPFIWPPVIYLLSALASAAASWAWSLPYQPPHLRWLGIVVGVAMIAAGIALAVGGERAFKRAGTPVPPTRPTTAIVETGIYRYTRNPMYLGMSLALAGLGVAFNQAWFLFAVPVAVFAVTKLAIEREEAYLATKFGAPYLAYKSRVRRWL